MKVLFATSAYGKHDDLVGMLRAGSMPFVPRKGDLVSVAKGGDFFEVDEVFWESTKPDHVLVYTKASGAAPTVAYLKNQGWKVESIEGYLHA